MSSIMEKVSPKYCLCGPGGTRTHDVYYPIKSRVPSPLGTPARWILLGSNQRPPSSQDGALPLC